MFRVQLFKWHFAQHDCLFDTYVRHQSALNLTSVRIITIHSLAPAGNMEHLFRCQVPSTLQRASRNLTGGSDACLETTGSSYHSTLFQKITMHLSLQTDPHLPSAISSPQGSKLCRVAAWEGALWLGPWSFPSPPKIIWLCSSRVGSVLSVVQGGVCFLITPLLGRKVASTRTAALQTLIRP